MATEPTPFYNKLNDFFGANEAYMWLMSFDELTPAEQALIGIWELQQEVINGGFFQYMHNSSGEHEPAMREHRDQLDAPEEFWKEVAAQ